MALSKLGCVEGSWKQNRKRLHVGIFLKTIPGSTKKEKRLQSNIIFLK
jgi:hypothetical protein